MFPERGRRINDECTAHDIAGAREEFCEADGGGIDMRQEVQVNAGPERVIHNQREAVFRCQLPNSALVIGEKGWIAIPDFWRATECALYELDERIDHFADGRASHGLCYQASAANRDLLAGRAQSDVVRLEDSLQVQRHLASVRALA